MKPTAPKPSIIITHVEGSGTLDIGADVVEMLLKAAQYWLLPKLMSLTAKLIDQQMCHSL